MDHTGELQTLSEFRQTLFVVDIDSNLIEYQPYRLNGCCSRYGFFGAALPIFDVDDSFILIVQFSFHGSQTPEAILVINSSPGDRIGHNSTRR